MKPEEFLAAGPFTLPKAEIIKYMCLLRDGLESWRKENPGAPWNTEGWFHEFLATKIFDAEERLKYAGCFFALPTVLKVMDSKKDIVHLLVSRGPNGDVHWELPHDCEPVCPH